MPARDSAFGMQPSQTTRVHTRHKQPRVHPASMKMVALALALVLCTGLCGCTSGTAAGVSAGHHVHKRGNLLASHSALEEGARRLPFGEVVAAGGVIDDAVALLEADGAVTAGETLKVSWSGVTAATADDLIAITCADRDWGLAQVFDAIAVTGKPAGTVELPPLPDLRCTYLLRYLRAQPPSPLPQVQQVQQQRQVAMVQAELRLDHARSPGLMPSQVHLGFTGKRDEMLVIFVSAHASPLPVVAYGTASGVYTANTTGTSSTYHAPDMCDAPANISGSSPLSDAHLDHLFVCAAFTLHGTKLPICRPNSRTGAVALLKCGVRMCSHQMV